MTDEDIRPTEDEASGAGSSPMEGPAQGPSGAEAGEVAGRPVEIEGVPSVPVRVPRRPDRERDERGGGAGAGAGVAAGAKGGRGKASGGGKAAGVGASLRIVERLPSRLGVWLLGSLGPHGEVKLGLISKRYPNRAQELVLDDDDQDLLDEAFGGPFKKLLKLLGLTSEEMAMVVVGFIVMAPRIGVIIEEESDKAKQRKAEAGESPT